MKHLLHLSICGLTLKPGICVFAMGMSGSRCVHIWTIGQDGPMLKVS